MMPEENVLDVVFSPGRNFTSEANHQFYPSVCHFFSRSHSPCPLGLAHFSILQRIDQHIH
jgi:hypothetical protein